LYQNYPNPFNPSTKIRFDISSEVKNSDNVRLIVFDVLGKEIETLVNENLRPGSYEIVWDASNYTSGIYFYKIFSGSFSNTNKMMLIK
jgi:hypothetical protein